ncbi:hypothetical protein J6590_004117 [Homalodisca vitripennis]|nr:hypothetical protein J6590_004117 [Homalodisca vitripennis]
MDDNIIMPNVTNAVDVLHPCKWLAAFTRLCQSRGPRYVTGQRQRNLLHVPYREQGSGPGPVTLGLLPFHVGLWFGRDKTAENRLVQAVHGPAVWCVHVIVAVKPAALTSFRAVVNRIRSTAFGYTLSVHKLYHNPALPGIKTDGPGTTVRLRGIPSEIYEYHLRKHKSTVNT